MSSWTDFQSWLFDNRSFGYDAAGNLVQSRDNWGGSYFGYDTLSRLAQRRTPRLDTVYYGYDGVSNLLRLQYPQDHAACYYGYDDAQRLSQLLSSAGHSCYYTYDASSNVTRRVMGNGVVSYATFDRTDRMLSLRYATSGGVGLAYFDYNRDVAGRILRIQREATAGYAIYYAYDQIDRLEAEVWRKSSDNSQIYGFWYSYDAANNRLQMRRETTAGVTWDSTYYQYAADNSLVRRHVATPPSTVVDTYYGYDANGALTQVLEGANATYFGYGANQLVTRILPPSEAATYFSYDGRLNRYYIDKAGTQTYYLWDGLNQLEERNADGSLKARYTQGNYRQYGIGSVVEIERHVGAATYYQYGLGDHRGTFYKITDQNQNVQIDYTLDAFGRQVTAPGGSNPAVPNDLIYQTNWFTLQIGGRWYGISRYRIYDFELGIFLSRDWLMKYLNKYRAWSNNPVGQVDKNGLANADSDKVKKIKLRIAELQVKVDEFTKRDKAGERGPWSGQADMYRRLIKEEEDRIKAEEAAQSAQKAAAAAKEAAEEEERISNAKMKADEEFAERAVQEAAELAERLRQMRGFEPPESLTAGSILTPGDGTIRRSEFAINSRKEPPIRIEDPILTEWGRIWMKYGLDASPKNGDNFVGSEGSIGRDSTGVQIRFGFENRSKVAGEEFGWKQEYSKDGGAWTQDAPDKDGYYSQGSARESNKGTDPEMGDYPGLEGSGIGVYNVRFRTILYCKSSNGRVAIYQFDWHVLDNKKATSSRVDFAISGKWLKTKKK